MREYEILVYGIHPCLAVDRAAGMRGLEIGVSDSPSHTHIMYISSKTHEVSDILEIIQIRILEEAKECRNVI